MTDKPSNEKLKGKVAIITGSSDGIGSGIAIEFSKAGASITLTGRSEDKLKKVAEKCKEVSPNKLMPLIIAGDITDGKVREKLIKETVKTYGKIDILVNNAGTANMIPIAENHGLKPLDEMLDIHVRAPYHLTKLAMEQLIANKGNIINTGSIFSIRPNLAIPAMEYGIAKAALNQFTFWLARELGPKGIRANCMCPGAIKTNLAAGPEAEMMFNSMANLHALQRTGTPDEVGRVAVFLASDDSSFVTGVALPVDGGQLIMPVGPLKI